jgi:hypothetical protein
LPISGASETSRGLKVSRKRLSSGAEIDHPPIHIRSWLFSVVGSVSTYAYLAFFILFHPGGIVNNQIKSGAFDA